MIQCWRIKIKNETTCVSGEHTHSIYEIIYVHGQMNICCISQCWFQCATKQFGFCLFSEEQYRKNVCYTQEVNNFAFNNNTSGVSNANKIQYLSLKCIANPI